MKRTLSLSYESYGTAARASDEGPEPLLPKDDREDELAGPSTSKKSVRFGGSDSADGPPSIPRPPTKAESSTATTEAGQSSKLQAPMIYVTDHDESPPLSRGRSRLFQAVEAVKHMNRVKQGFGTGSPAQAFLPQRALARAVGVKGTDHQGLETAGEMDGSEFSCEPHASDTRASSPSPLSLLPAPCDPGTCASSSAWRGSERRPSCARSSRSSGAATRCCRRATTAGAPSCSPPRARAASPWCARC